MSKHPVQEENDLEEAQKNVHTIAEKSQTALKFNPTQAKSAFAAMKAVLEGTKTNEEKVAEIEALQNGVEDTTAQAFANVAKGILGLKETQATVQEKSDTLKELVSEFGFIENLGDDEKDPAAKEQCSLNMVQAVGAMQAKKDADGKLIEPAEARDNLNPHIAEAIQTSFQGTVNDAIEVESHEAEEKKKSELRTSEDYKDLDISPAIRCGKAAVAIGLAFVPGVGIFLAIGFLIATRNMGNGPQLEDEEKENDLPDMDLLEYGEEFLKDFLESGQGVEHPHQEHEEEGLEHKGLEDDLNTVQESAPPPSPAKFSASTANSTTAATIYHDATAEGMLDFNLREEEDLGEGLDGDMKDQSMHGAPPAPGLQPPLETVGMSLDDISLTVRGHDVIGEMDRSSSEFIGLTTTGALSQVGMEAGKVKVEVTEELSYDNNVLGSTHKSLARITSGEEHPLQGTEEIYQAQQSQREQDAIATRKAKINQTKKIVPSDEDELSEEDESLLASVNAMRANELNPNQEEKQIVAAKLNDMVVAEVDAVNDSELLEEEEEVNFSDNKVKTTPSISNRIWNYLFSSPSAAASLPEQIEMVTITSNPLNEKGLTASSLTAEQADLLAASGKAQSQFTQNPVAGNSSAHQEEGEMRDEDDEVWDEPEDSRLRRKAIMDYKKMHPTAQQAFDTTELLEPDEESMYVEESHLNNSSPVTVATTDQEFSLLEDAKKVFVAASKSISNFSHADVTDAHSTHMANSATMKDNDLSK